jgi:hypothetical protein
LRAVGNDEVKFGLRQVHSPHVEGRAPRRVNAVFDMQVLPLDPAAFAQAITKGGEQGLDRLTAERRQNTDSCRFAWLLGQSVSRNAQSPSNDCRHERAPRRHHHGFTLRWVPRTPPARAPSC